MLRWEGPHAGKGTSELGLLRKLVSAFSAGDVMLADAFYCNYFLIAALQALGVDVLFAQNGARNTDFRRGESEPAQDSRCRVPGNLVTLNEVCGGRPFE